MKTSFTDTPQSPGEKYAPQKMNVVVLFQRSCPTTSVSRSIAKTVAETRRSLAGWLGWRTVFCILRDVDKPENPMRRRTDVVNLTPPRRKSLRYPEVANDFTSMLMRRNVFLGFELSSRNDLLFQFIANEFDVVCYKKNRYCKNTPKYLWNNYSLPAQLFPFLLRQFRN